MNKKKIHRGELLKKVVDESGAKLQKVLAKAEYHRSTFYSHIHQRDLRLDILYKYAKAIPFDFSIYFPEMSAYETDPGPVDYNSLSQAEAVRYLKQWREKYFVLLEENHDLRVRNDMLQDLLTRKDKK